MSCLSLYVWRLCSISIWRKRRKQSQNSIHAVTRKPNASSLFYRGALPVSKISQSNRLMSTVYGSCVRKFQLRYVPQQFLEIQCVLKSILLMENKYINSKIIAHVKSRKIYTWLIASCISPTVNVKLKQTEISVYSYSSCRNLSVLIVHLCSISIQ